MTKYEKGAYRIGVAIGRFVRNCLIFFGLFVAVALVVATGEGNATAKAKTEQVAKPVKKAKAKAVKQAKKKCHCDCKKVIDTAANPVTDIYIGIEHERLTNDEIKL